MNRRIILLGAVGIIIVVAFVAIFFRSNESAMSVLPSEESCVAEGGEINSLATSPGQCCQGLKPVGQTLDTYYCENCGDGICKQNEKRGCPEDCQNHLIAYAEEFFTRFEGSGVLTSLVITDSSNLKSLVQEAPSGICLQLEVFSENGSLFYHIDNINDTSIGLYTGCQQGAIAYSTNSSRTYELNETNYLVTLKLFETYPSMAKANSND